MPHVFKVGQLVALAQTSRDLETYGIVQLMPETAPARKRNTVSRDWRAAPFALCTRPRLSRTAETRIGAGLRKLRSSGGLDQSSSSEAALTANKERHWRLISFPPSATTGPVKAARFGRGPHQLPIAA
jgi:hypothetical protein